MAAKTSIIIDSINFTDKFAKFEEEPQSQVYLDYRIESKYEKDYHTYMMPMAFANIPAAKKIGATISASYASTPSTSFVQLAAPTLLWIVDWSCSRSSEMPEIPYPYVSMEKYGWILLAENYEPAMLRIAADGMTPVYRISGTYVYGHINPSSVTLSDLIFPRPPWLEEFVTRTLPTSMFKIGLIDLETNRNFGLRT